MCPSLVYNFLNQFYPEREITVISSDPRYVTPPVKAVLRRKKRFMRAGRTDEADALSGRIRAVITGSSSKWLRKVDTSKSPKYCVDETPRSLTWHRKKLQQTSRRPTAQLVMNDYYAAISTDSEYHAPDSKHTARERADNFITEMEVFRILDTLRPTATGLDAIPAWFLRLWAPVFAGPIAQLFNQSISNGGVPRQWKTAVITPVPKVSKPAHPSDYRPISITPVLLRSLEKVHCQKVHVSSLIATTVI